MMDMRKVATIQQSPGFESNGGDDMPVQLSADDRRYLEKLASRKMRPTSRQKAQALLSLDCGDPLENVSMRVGITKEELAFLVGQFTHGGLEAVGLVRPQRKSSGRNSVRGYPTIEKTPGVCGGAARVAGTRIPVWQLVAARETGASEGQLLMDFPRLKARNLVDAWAYAADHPQEIRAEIHANEVA
jgi:uncharacterized protein (DUF433 family)